MFDGDPTTAEFEQIVRVCDGFEAQWRSGYRPRIEEVIARNPSLPRPVLFRELLALELELARTSGDTPMPSDYQSRFPDWIEVIDAEFAAAAEDAARTRTSRPDAAARGFGTSYSLPIPVMIGRYVVLSLLDEGGQGRVFRVVHPGLGKDLVLKLAAQPVGCDPAGRGLLAAEGRLLAELDHPSLVRVFDVDVDDDGRPFVVMEHVAGCTLDRHFENSLPAPRRAAAMVAEIARAVGYVHGRGVVHQDIKPRNILLDEAGRPRLIDFGLARLRHAWTDDASGPSGGTLMFMAPEQARGEVERVGAAADIYALGGVLYFLLTGRSPVGNGSRSEIYERARRGAVNVLALESSPAPRRLRNICLNALSPEPAARYASAHDLAKELERVAQGPRRATILAACAVLFLALVSALAFWTWSERVVTPPTLAGSDQSLVHLVGRDRPSDLREALPLRNDDQLWVSCKVPHGASPSMFWLDSEGALTELRPEVMTGETSDTLCYPPTAPAGVVGLQGPPGTEFVLVCAGAVNRWLKRRSKKSSEPGDGCPRCRTK